MPGPRSPLDRAGLGLPGATTGSRQTLGERALVADPADDEAVLLVAIALLEVEPDPAGDCVRRYVDEGSPSEERVVIQRRLEAGGE